MGAVKSVRKMGQYRPKVNNELRLSSYLKKTEIKVTTENSTNKKSITPNQSSTPSQSSIPNQSYNMIKSLKPVEDNKKKIFIISDEIRSDHTEFKKQKWIC